MSEFKQQLKDNDGSHEIEVDSLTVGNETCSYYYFKDTDSIQIIFWDEHHGDEQKFITTHKFNSFKEYVTSNEDMLVAATNNWDYKSESVYQSFSDIDFDEWIYENEGRDALVEFIDFQLAIHGTQYVKRSLCDRVSRWFNLKMYNLNNN